MINIAKGTILLRTIILSGVLDKERIILNQIDYYNNFTPSRCVAHSKVPFIIITVEAMKDFLQSYVSLAKNQTDRRTEGQKDKRTEEQKD